MKAWTTNLRQSTTLVAVFAVLATLMSASPAVAADAAFLSTPLPGAVITGGYHAGHPAYDYDISGGSSDNTDDVVAVADGEVVGSFAGCKRQSGGTSSSPNADEGKDCGGGFGNWVVLRHELAGGGTIYSSYSHLDDVFTTSGCVPRGAPLGELGHTGHSTAEHLHFEFNTDQFKSGHTERAQSRDPGDYLGKNSVTNICESVDVQRRWQTGRHAHGSADFDGDGLTDVFRTAGAGWNIRYGSGGSWAKVSNSGYELDKLGFGDFNGDGATDVFRTDGDGDYWNVAYGGQWQWTRINSSAYDLDQVALGDFNGDGTTDVFRTAGAGWHISYGGSGGWTKVSNSGYELDKLGFGDFNGDGATDVFRTDGDGDYWNVAYGGQWQWTRINSSAYDLDQVALGDFNGDGTTDVFRTAGAGWHISYGGSGGWTKVSNSAYELDKLAFGDLDGDRRTDVFRTAGDGWTAAYGGEWKWKAYGGSSYELQALTLGSAASGHPDKIDPSTTLTASPSGLVASRRATVRFSSDEPGTFQCRLDGAGFAACSSPAVFTGLADGSHTVAVRAIDMAGNVDPSPATRTWTVDATAPQTTITSGPSGTSDDTAATLRFGSNEVATFQCSHNGAAFVSCTSPVSYSGLADGDHTVRVRAIDTAGNTDGSPAARTWTVATTPPTVAPPADADTFTDDDGSPFAAAHEWLAANGITRGCNPPTNDRFCGDEAVTRGQMAAFLVRALDLPVSTMDRFDDDDRSVFEADIQALAAAGITLGCNPPTNDRFCPTQTVSRKQMAAFLTRALDLPVAKEGFSDVSSSDTFAGSIGALAAAEITRGCNPPTNNRFCPDGDVTRSQMAAFIERALG